MDYYKFYFLMNNNQSVDVAVRDDQYQVFLDCVQKNKPFFDEKTNCGFYIQPDKYFYFTYMKMTANKELEEDQESSDSEDSLE